MHSLTADLSMILHALNFGRFSDTSKSKRNTLFIDRASSFILCPLSEWRMRVYVRNNWPLGIRTCKPARINPAFNPPVIGAPEFRGLDLQMVVKVELENIRLYRENINSFNLCSRLLMTINNDVELSFFFLFRKHIICHIIHPR